MTELQEKLYSLSDCGYAAFQAKLTPTVPPEKIIGVRLPDLRRFAAEFAKEPACLAFLRDLPHEFYDENLLHGVLLGRWRDYGECLRLVEEFLPYVDNWAVCDTMRPIVFGRHRDQLLPRVKEWIASEPTYTCRFGIGILMSHYLDESFDSRVLEWPAAVRLEDYYVEMMAAWFYATALAKRWDAALPYLEDGRLSESVRLKTVQKACESRRITPEQKAFLKGIRASGKK